MSESKHNPTARAAANGELRRPAEPLAPAQAAVHVMFEGLQIAETTGPDGKPALLWTFTNRAGWAGSLPMNDEYLEKLVPMLTEVLAKHLSADLYTPEPPRLLGPNGEPV